MSGKMVKIEDYYHDLYHDWLLNCAELCGDVRDSESKKFAYYGEYCRIGE